MEHHFLCRLKEEGIIRVKWTPKEEMSSDLFTKNLGRALFAKHVKTYCRKDEYGLCMNKKCMVTLEGRVLEGESRKVVESHDNERLRLIFEQKSDKNGCLRACNHEMNTNAMAEGHQQVQSLVMKEALCYNE